MSTMLPKIGHTHDTNVVGGDKPKLLGWHWLPQIYCHQIKRIWHQWVHLDITEIHPS